MTYQLQKVSAAAGNCIVILHWVRDGELWLEMLEAKEWSALTGDHMDLADTTASSADGLEPAGMALLG